MTSHDPSLGAQAHFSSAAPTYDRHAHVQREAADHLFELIEDITPSTILEVGCGTGLLTRRIAARWPEAPLTAVDIAPGMIEAAQRSMPDAKGMRWVVSDFRSFSRQDRFGLVVSNCALHWMQPIASAIVRAAGLLEVGGHFAASLMLEGTLSELHAARHEAAPDKAALHGMPELNEVTTACAAAGLAIVRQDITEHVHTSPTVDELVRALREQGLTSGSLGRGKALLTRGELARLKHIYAQRFGVTGGVRVSYRIGYVVARR